MNEPVSPTMLDTLLKRIVADVVPEELTSYNLTGRKIIDDVLSGRDPKRSGGGRFGNEFGGDVGDWAPFVQIVISTVSLFVQFVQAGRNTPPKEQELADKWTANLKAADVEPDLAVSIAQKFGEDFLVTIRAQTGRAVDE